MACIRKWRRSEQDPNINNARQLDRKNLADYAAYLSDVVIRGDIPVNTLSSVNIALRGDQYVRLPSSSRALGMHRTGVRRSVPQGQDREQMKQIVDALCRHHQLRTAVIVLLERATGIRLRKAILADLPRLILETDDLFRAAPKAVAPGLQRYAGSRWTTMFEVHLNLHVTCHLWVAAT